MNNSDALEAHARRVAALACEIARRLNMPVEAVCDAALRRQRTIRNQGLERLARDLQSLSSAVVTPPPGPPSPRIEAVIEVAEAFEQGVEFAPYEPRSAQEILGGIEELGFDAEAVRALRSISVPAPPAPSKLIPYPTVLFEALRVLRSEDATFGDIERLGQSDQVFASSLLSVANAALFAPVTPIKSIGRAISHIGIDTAKKVILAGAARPLFASAPLRMIWQHSVDVATIAERLARAGGRIDPAEAFAAGLIHDIGRLAIESLPREIVGTYRRIGEDAQCLILADMVVLGCEHGEFGARVLESWGAPSDLTSAVALHHRPELSPQILPNLLYLAEFASASDEDIPSAARLKAAMTTVGIAGMGQLFELAAFDRRMATVLAAAS